MALDPAGIAHARKNDKLRAHILVVDDHAPTCELICEILCSAGEKFHAVFLDMRMSPPDGIALARQVRASAVNASTVIVMITGEEDRTFIARAFEAGVEFFLFKPIERNMQAPSRLLTHQGLRFGNLGHSKTTKVELLVWPVLMVTRAWLVVCRKIVYEERIWAQSQPGGRFAFLCAIPLGKGVADEFGTH